LSATAQHAALTGLVTRILGAPTGFYEPRLHHAGVRSGRDIANESLARISLTRRADLVRDQLDHLPHGTRRLAGADHPVRTGVTGSGDALLVLAWTAADLARERAAGARVLGRLGIRAGMRVANTLPGALVTPGSLLLGDVIEEIGGLDVPLGAIDSDAAAKPAWELIDRVQPEVLVLEAATGARLIAAAPVTRREWWRGVIWLRRGAAAMPAPPELPGFSGWQRTWFAVPEASSFVASSCSAGHFHVDEGLIAEVVDPSGAPLAGGHDGELALTTLDLDTPVLRYATGVAARIVASPCSCGESGSALELR